MYSPSNVSIKRMGSVPKNSFFSQQLRQSNTYKIAVNAFKVIHSLFLFKQPKRRGKMTAQTCMFSTDAIADKEADF